MLHNNPLELDPHQQYTVALLSHHNFNPDLFQNRDQLSYSAPIEAHAAWAFTHIYSIPHPNAKEKGEIARHFHGMQHVCRAAIYLPVFANLYRKYGDQAALALTGDDIKLLQIAMLLHDAGRQDDMSCDETDDESGTLLFLYLRMLGIDEKKAILLAEAAANKDRHAEGYHRLIVKDNQLSWAVVEQLPKNIYQKLIHDADCLDIIRARDNFDAVHLDFYQDIASRVLVPAFNELAQVVVETKGMIARQGDGRQHHDTEVKLQYEVKDGYTKIYNDMIDGKNGYCILRALYNKAELLDQAELAKPLVVRAVYDPRLGHEEKNIEAALHEGLILARGVGLPSAINIKPLTNNDGTSKKESLAETEIRKAARRPAIETTSSKANCMKKKGNSYRSSSLLGDGAGVFTSAGFLIIDYKIENISSMSIVDSDTGWQKKEGFELKQKLVGLDEKKEKLSVLRHQLKMGGSARRFRDFPSYPADHTEITYDIEDYHAVYFSSDPTLRNMIDIHTPLPQHPFSPLLQALYLQQAYKKYHGRTLSVYEYIKHPARIRKVKEEEYAPDKLTAMWEKMCADYIQSNFDLLSIGSITKLAKQSPDDIKINAMYGHPFFHFLHQGFYAADSNYPLEWQVNPALVQNVINKILKENHGQMTRCLFAAASGNLAEFINYLDKPIINNWTDNAHYIIMHAAIANGHIDVVRHLITQSTSRSLYLFSTSNNYETSTLYLAAAYNHVDIAQLLLAQGLDINAADTDGETGLYAAAEKGHIAMVNALLDAGAMINQANHDGKTPLIIAIENRHDNVVERLLEKGADTQVTFAVPSTDLLAVIYAAEKGLVNKIEDQDTLTMTSLHWAALFGFDKLVKKLLENRALSIGASEKVSPLELAAAVKNDAILAILLLHEPEKLGEIILLGNYSQWNFLLHITAEDKIEEVVENPMLMNKILRSSNTASIIDHLTTVYFKKRGLPITVNNSEINMYHYADSALFRENLLTGKITGYQQDAFGRYIIHPVDLANGARIKDAVKTFTDKDLSKCNFNLCSLREFNLTNSLWCFYEADYVRFDTCSMDAFNVTPGSNMRNVTLIDPIFSDKNQVEKLVSFYPIVPAFILEKKYIDILKKSIAEGKKIELSRPSVLNKLEKSIRDNEIDVFNLALSHLETAPNEEDLITLLHTAVTTSHALPFVQTILQWKIVAPALLLQVPIPKSLCLELQLSIEKKSLEEKSLWEDLNREKNPIKRANHGREIGLPTPVPSLQHISFFVVKQRTKRDKAFHDKVKQSFNESQQEKLIKALGGERRFFK